MVSDDFALWQLLDSALPTGSFAHSGGLEAWQQAGRLRQAEDLQDFLQAALAQAAAQALPLVEAARDDVGALIASCRRARALLLNPVARRASEAQGAALLRLGAELSQEAEMQLARRACRTASIAPQQAPAWGFVCARLGIAAAACRRGFLYMTLRDLLSAGVRLAAIGPLAAQSLQWQLRAVCEAAARSQLGEGAELAQVHPLADLVHAGHDELYSRLFNS